MAQIQNHPARLKRSGWDIEQSCKHRKQVSRVSSSMVNTINISLGNLGGRRAWRSNGSWKTPLHPSAVA